MDYWLDLTGLIIICPSLSELLRPLNPGATTMSVLDVLDRLARPPDHAEPSICNTDLRSHLTEAQLEVNCLQRDYISLYRQMVYRY